MRKDLSIKGYICLALVLLLTTTTKATTNLPNLTEAFKRVAPSVVNIFTVKKIKLKPNNPYEYFAQLYGKMPKQITRRSLGSGVIYSSDGYIITNYHVVENAPNDIRVVLRDGTVLKAKLVGYDRGTDIAVLKVNPKGHKLVPAPLGDSDKLQIAEWVIAIGNPFGLSYTVTAGIVSAKGRIIGDKAYDQFIQTDASINPGNSGGPLVNAKGEVVGINTAIIKNAQGIGFAIPINLVKNVVSQIIAKGKVVRGWLGVEAEDVKPPKKGALITKVAPGGPAAKAGLKPGDIIVSFNGKKVNRTADLAMWIAEAQPGTEVKVKILRGGKLIEKKVVLGTLKELELSRRTLKLLKILGIKLAKGKEGYYVESVAPKSPAEESMLRKGDIILEINRRPIKSASDIEKALRHVRRGDFILVRVKREGKRYYIAIPVP